MNEQTTIQIGRDTQTELKAVGTMEDTYDTVIKRLIEEHKLFKRIEFFVDTQHKIAKMGKFVGLD